MDIVTRENKLFWGYWKYLIDTVHYQHPAYSSVGLEFYKEYFFSDMTVKDESFIVVNNGVAIIGIVLSVHAENNLIRMSGFGRGINYMENSNGNCEGIKSARKIFKKNFESIVKSNHVNTLFMTDYTSVDGTLSLLARLFLDRGGVAQTNYLQLIDLAKPTELIHSDLSKSCRNSVNWGRNNLDISYIDASSITKNNVEDLRQLHIHEAGRETRSKKSWELMYDMINENVAFILEGRLDGSLVTSSLFYYNKPVCLYAVSASTRALFDKPIGHIVLWEAINQAKKLGCKYFDFGGLSYNSSEEVVSKKQIDINRYKKNFGGETIIQLNINWHTEEIPS
jgi:hypothetical protein